MSSHRSGELIVEIVVYSKYGLHLPVRLFICEDQHGLQQVKKAIW